MKRHGALLSPLHEKPSILTECLFVDSIADIAVLGEPDGQELYDECEAYESLMESLTPIPIADAPEKGTVWLLSLKDEWFSCSFQRGGIGRAVVSPLWLSELQQHIKGGMSGSPIVSDEGAAIGVVNLGNATHPDVHQQQTVLFQNLPGFCLPHP